MLDATITVLGEGSKPRLVAGARPADKGNLNLSTFTADQAVSFDGQEREVVSVEIAPAQLNRGGEVEECMVFNKQIRAPHPLLGSEVAGSVYLALSSNRI